jgi:hypothetical protein
VAGQCGAGKQKAAVRAELIKRVDVERSGIRGGGDDRNTTPEYWVGGAALKAPQRKRLCCCRGANAGLLWSIPEDVGAIQPMVGGWIGMGMVHE